MRTLFTANLTDLPADADRDDALALLEDSLQREFPAYYVSQVLATDFSAAIVVSARWWGEKHNGEVPIPAHLNGWGAGALTLTLVA